MTLPVAGTPARPSAVLPARPAGTAPATATSAVVAATKAVDLDGKVKGLVGALAGLGMVFEPWQVAAYVTAIRTKPFVVLAGVSGTGKSKLPRLAADLTGSSFELIPVKPDWTDSAQTIGYENLNDDFVPGDFLRAARAAEIDGGRHHFVLLDEMNLARIEYYLAEFLSLSEERTRLASGAITSPPLAPRAPAGAGGGDWSAVSLAGNLSVVGSLNMDETTHAFSRKVLDRAFVLEFVDVDLTKVPAAAKVERVEWSADDWAQPMVSVREMEAGQRPMLDRTGTELNAANVHLKPLQMQVGYRVRDELALFCVNAEGCIDSFVTSGGKKVDPLDLGVSMKVLPRIQGGGRTIKKALDGLAEWANGSGTEPRFPLTLERIDAMRNRLDDEGFTSFWL